VPVLNPKNNFVYAAQFFVVFSFLMSSTFHTNPVVATVIQPFKGEGLNSFAGTLRVSSSNPRYFTDDSGRVVYLTGSHTWANLQDAGYSNPPPVFDYTAYLNFLQANNHNFFRLWTWEQTRWASWTSNDIRFAPSPYQRTGPGNALDGSPRFNLTKFNQDYFDRLRSRTIAAGNRGIYVSVMLFDGFSVGTKNAGDTGNPWPGHPFHAKNNVNGINGDPNGDGNGYDTQNLSISGVTALQEAYVRKVIDTVNDLDNVLYEICNECASDSTAWQYHMIDYIHNYEKTKPKQHPVGMTVEYPDGDNNELFSSPADWISVNDNGNYKEDPPAADGSKVIITDTDHLWGEGAGSDRAWVWKSFTRGLNPIFMDCYNANYCEGENPNDPAWVSLRQNLGYALSYAGRMNLVDMSPQPSLCSTTYCLANTDSEGGEILVYLPKSKITTSLLETLGMQLRSHESISSFFQSLEGKVTVDLSFTTEDLTVEWFNPEDGSVEMGGTVSGGGTRSFTSPFAGDAVLYIYLAASSQATPTATQIQLTSTPSPTSTFTPTSTPIQTSTTISPTGTPVSSGGSSPCAVGFLPFIVIFGLSISIKKLANHN
jgi:hypothetical protein